MKRLWILAIVAAMLCTMSACSGWIKDDYLSVSAHIEQTFATAAPTQEEHLTVSNRNELRGTVLGFIRNWTEHGVIFVENYEGDVNTDLTETVRYITQEDPIGAYAVDYADAELLDNVIEVNIVFRRSAAEIDSIVTVNGNAAAFGKIQTVLENYDTALTLRIRSYQETDFTAFITRYCMEHPDSVLAVPEISAELYPDQGETRILELHFSYPESRDEMRLKQESVHTILSSAASYIRSGKTDREKIALLYRFLCERFHYTIAQEEPTMPAYNLLCDGLAHSRSFSSVFFAQCKNAGVECLLVSGQYGELERFWNMVCLDGQYYYVDLMHSVELGETQLHLLSSEELWEAGYVWDAAAYPATPAAEKEDPKESTEPVLPPETEPTTPPQPTEPTQPEKPTEDS